RDAVVSSEYPSQLFLCPIPHLGVVTVEAGKNVLQFAVERVAGVEEEVHNDKPGDNESRDQEQLQDELARGRGDWRQARLGRGWSPGRAAQGGGLLLRIGGKAGVRLHSRVPRQDLSEPSVFVVRLHGRRQGCRAPRLNADPAPATVEEREVEP